MNIKNIPPNVQEVLAIVTNIQELFINSKDFQSGLEEIKVLKSYAEEHDVNVDESQLAFVGKSVLDKPSTEINRIFNNLKLNIIKDNTNE